MQSKEWGACLGRERRCRWYAHMSEVGAGFQGRWWQERRVTLGDNVHGLLLLQFLPLLRRPSQTAAGPSWAKGGGGGILGPHSVGGEGQRINALVEPLLQGVCKA